MLVACRDAHDRGAGRDDIDGVGADRLSGLHSLAPGKGCADAVPEAGGATAKAELELVNLAAPLADGEQVVVPVRGAAAAAAGGGGTAAAPLGPNTATPGQPDAPPGIGAPPPGKNVALRPGPAPLPA